MNIIGLDIGGANIKAADADGRTLSRPFAIWKLRDQLGTVLQQMLSTWPAPPDIIAVTMTAELADCFATRAEGVEYIISTVEHSFPNSLLRVWLTSGEFADADDARDLPTLVAAANWHALATWAGRAVSEGPALLLDIGSTTTDIIPLLDGFPVSEGLNDLERLLACELVYTGSFRTPVCAVLSSVPFEGRLCPIAAELFATVADAWLVAGLTPEQPACTDTADGRPLTLEASRNRMAHMLCCDGTDLLPESLQEVATAVVDAQSQQIAAAVRRVLQRLDELTADQGRSPAMQRPVVIVTGSGTFVAEHVLNHVLPQDLFSSRMLVSRMFRSQVTECACAFAVARLAHDRCSDDLLELQLF